MSNRAPRLTLAALFLAAATLAGCGGGSAEAPPLPVGPGSGGPDTTPPTILIANDVAAAQASGPVTFSFVFSEDVGISFDATDIVVSGGTAGAFNRLSGTQATLVVTPPPNSSGTITVSVAAGTFSDLAGNASTAAANATKDYVVSTPVTPTPLVYSSGFAGGGRTAEGGAVFSYSGSNLDGFACNGDPANCGSGSGGSGATSFFFAYYQTPTPATALYNGISVLAPGVTTVSTTGDTAGVQLNGQNTVDFTFNNNPEWQASGTNNFGVILKLGKFYDVGTPGNPAPCNIQLLSVVTPLNNGGATAYSLPLSGFQIIQSCNSGITTVAAALAAAPVSEIAFQAAGGGSALPTVGGKTTGANFSVATGGGVYPTTVALTGGITFGVSTAPVASTLDYSTGFAGGGRTVEGGAVFSYSGSNLDNFSCNGDPANCGSGSGGSGATSFFFAYYQTTTPATALYNGVSILAPGITAVSTTGDTGGMQISGQTTLNFSFNNNPEWQASGTNNFGVILKLGKFYDVGTPGAPAPCNIQLLSVVTPLNNGASTAYALPLSDFQIIQSCNSGITTVAAALAAAPVSEIAFQAAGGGSALPTVSGKTTGANFTVQAGGTVYPTTIALTGGISFKP
ncbi:MAG: hypothetical protein RL722_134 [Pseudomonadota bacterium]|jgi:hypothetical protein